MSRPRLLVNNLIENNLLVNNSDTKVYLIVLAIFGIDRLFLISINRFSKYIIRFLNIIAHLFILFNTYKFFVIEISAMSLMISFTILQHTISIILARSRSSNVEYFFTSISRFDEIYSSDLKLQPKFGVFKTITFLLCVSMVSISSYILLPVFHEWDFSLVHIVIMGIRYEFEQLFYAHLLKITNDRVNIIKDSLKRLLNINYEVTANDTERYTKHHVKPEAYIKEISQLQSSYELLADSTCRQYEAVKWQVSK